MVLQILRASREPAPEAKSAPPVVAFHPAGRVAWSARDAGTLTEIGFQRNPVAFRCVKLIAEAAAAVPVVVQDADRRFDAHPVLSLIDARTHYDVSPDGERLLVRQPAGPMGPGIKVVLNWASRLRR